MTFVVDITDLPGEEGSLDAVHYPCIDLTWSL